MRSYKHGKRIMKNGVRKYVYQWVWEEFYGKPIPEGYDIHHIDGNVDNNDIDNLALLPHGGHSKITSNAPERKAKQREVGRKVGLSNRAVGPTGTSWCWKCQQFLPTLEFTKNKHTWNKLDQICRSCKKIQNDKFRKKV